MSHIEGESRKPAAEVGLAFETTRSDPQVIAMNESHFETYTWYRRYVTNVLRHLLGWDEQQLQEWVDSSLPYPPPDEITLMCALHEYPTYYVVGHLIPDDLRSRLRPEESLTLQRELHRAIVGEDDHDYAEGGDWDVLKTRVKEVLRRHGGTLPSGGGHLE